MVDLVDGTLLEGSAKVALGVLVCKTDRTIILIIIVSVVKKVTIVIENKSSHSSRKKTAAVATDFKYCALT